MQSCDEHTRQWIDSTHLSLCLQTCNTADLNLPELLPAFEGSAQHFLQSAVSSAQQQAPELASPTEFHPFLTRTAEETTSIEVSCTHIYWAA